MTNTFVKLYRKIESDPMLSRHNNAFVVFVKILLTVDYKTGSMTTGRNKFGALCNMKPSTAWTILLRLESHKYIKIIGHRTFSEIVVLNWQKYQDNSPKLDKDSTPTRQVARQVKTEVISENSTGSSTKTRQSSDTYIKNKNNNIYNREIEKPKKRATRKAAEATRLMLRARGFNV